MSRLSEDNLRIANEIIDRYPIRKSALIPLLHLAQEQEGWVTDEAMNHIAEIIGITPAEVLGTCSFYEMFKRQPNGEYQVNICHGISCHLLGADQLIQHAEETLGIREGETTADGKFTLEGVECIAACTEAPCMQVNYRYQNQVTESQFDELVQQIQAEEKNDIPKHGSLAKVRQNIPAARMAGFQSIDEGSEPVWLKRNGATK
ncbi:MAG: NADH-quinone oxidoreductase subunit NuoE [Actinomycetota bacterium]|nr:NADH-quinone oxidoreductase subunit NuoE [Actinomycetota bacterium]MEC7530818.1 NADH-quinone oxidoreductase subunit NuoE [Actinomycetota bacterium]MEC7608267.1 NADH-quinone oxidoreductase subunit NuoE [Actinomycetota bacterium]MEC8119854.1 NADH-quinone oxidoreductase subunit NuoE [Actinomycetota bacterium]MEC8334392.1 NADH-quinone oxidoreductase subunit NuoE [Actinomycetota bacterium]|tara:strand:+ start:7751 stop:8362 length:612 start_codon:yes stop_codon:yes gene_type:complete